MILQNMKNLLECLPGLERLELVDMQFEQELQQHKATTVSARSRRKRRGLLRWLARPATGA